MRPIEERLGKTGPRELKSRRPRDVLGEDFAGLLL